MQSGLTESRSLTDDPSKNGNANYNDNFPPLNSSASNISYVDLLLNKVLNCLTDLLSCYFPKDFIADKLIALSTVLKETNNNDHTNKNFLEQQKLLAGMLMA